MLYWLGYEVLNVMLVYLTVSIVVLGLISVIQGHMTIEISRVSFTCLPDLIYDSFKATKSFTKEICVKKELTKIFLMFLITFISFVFYYIIFFYLLSDRVLFVSSLMTLINVYSLIVIIKFVDDES